jgi:glycosyltransferase involved in cell wall biosynthesis
MAIIKGRDIVIVGLQPWDTEIGSNCKDIAMEFSKNNRVLYVNYPLDRISKIRHQHNPQVQKRLAKIRSKENNLELVAPNLWVYYPDVILESINWIKISFIFDPLNKRNNRIYANAIQKAIKELDMKAFILFNDNDIFRGLHLKAYLKPAVSIYYSRDNLLGTDYWKYHGKRLEPKIMANSDVCVANSRYLTAICKLYNKNSYDVGQGCEIKEFLTASECNTPEKMENIPLPIVGYVGALTSSRLAIDIITDIAVNNPLWSIVLVGPEDETFKLSGLHELKNVHFLGAVNPEELPAYIGSFSVCINPQQNNELTIGNYPRKIDEYLAAGKPVIATKTEAMEAFKDHCYLASNPSEFILAIQKAIVSDSPDLIQLRKQFASSHTWENSVGKIYAAIERYISNS